MAAALPDTIVQWMNYRTDRDLSYWSLPVLFHGSQVSIVSLLSAAEQEATSLSSGMNFIWWHQFSRSAWNRERFQVMTLCFEPQCVSEQMPCF